jgi:hypothetical protein
LSGAIDQHDRARDMIAGLLTRNRGEYIFRLGARPTNEHLFAPPPKGTDLSWNGAERTIDELATLRREMTLATEEVGGKVCQ